MLMQAILNHPKPTLMLKKKVIIAGYYPSNYEVNILKFIEKALENYSRSADMGSDFSAEHAGYLYGTINEYDKAFKYLKKVEPIKNRHSQFNIEFIRKNRIIIIYFFFNSQVDLLSNF